MGTDTSINTLQYAMTIEWSDEDEAYVVSFPEWEAAGHLAHTHGATYEEAARKGAELLAFIVTSAQQDGDLIPAPRHFDYDSHHPIAADIKSVSA